MPVLHGPQLVFLIIAMVCFAFSAFSSWRWSTPQGAPAYYWPGIALGLFFATLTWLWPSIIQ